MTKSSQAERSYDQYCALALSLDRIGDRWTLLIIRELLLGPRRFSELRHGLPGIATNLLTERLRRLESDGIVARREGRYDLTDAGRALEPVVHAFVRWGGRWMTGRAKGTTFRPPWLAVAMKALVRPPTARTELTVELRVDGEPITIVWRPAGLEIAVGPADRPDVVLSADPETVIGIVAGATRVRDAVATGRATAIGERSAVRELERLFSGRG